MIIHLEVEDDWGLISVVCRKVHRGIGRCGEQQQEGVLKKQKEPGSRTDQDRTPSVIKLRHGGGVVWYVGYVWCVWSVWYGMFGKYGMFGMYGRYGMYGMSGWYCMDGRYGM